MNTLISLELARAEVARLAGQPVSAWGMSGDPANGSGKWRFMYDDGTGFDLDVNQDLRSMSLDDFSDRVLRPAMHKSKAQGAGLITLSFDDLGRLLGLPEGVKVVRGEYDITTDRMRFAIQGPGLVQTVEGCPAYTYRVQMHEKRVTRIDWEDTLKL